MLTPELCGAFLLGAVIGGVAGYLISDWAVSDGFRSASAELHRIEEERRRKDPANWWKYGGDPFEDSDDSGGTAEG